MEEGSRRGIYGERIPLCKRGVVWQLQELSEQAVRDIFETEERLGTEQRALERGGDFSGGDSLELRL